MNGRYAACGVRPGRTTGARRTGAGAGVPGTRAERVPVARGDGVRVDAARVDAARVVVEEPPERGVGSGSGGGFGAPWGQLTRDMSQ